MPTTVKEIGIQDIATAIDLSVVSEAPFAGALAKSGFLLDNAYSWAALMALAAPSAAYVGLSVWVIDWQHPFFWDGSLWIPEGYKLILSSGRGTGVAVNGLGTTVPADWVTFMQDVIPVGLMRANCRVEISQLWEYTGTNAVKYAGVTLGLPPLRDNSAAGAHVAGANCVYLESTAAAGTLSMRTKPVFEIEAPTGTGRTHSTNFLEGRDSLPPAVMMNNFDVNWTNENVISHGFIAHASDTAQLMKCTVEIYYPR